MFAVPEAWVKRVAPAILQRFGQGFGGWGGEERGETVYFFACLSERNRKGFQVAFEKTDGEDYL